MKNDDRVELEAGCDFAEKEIFDKAFEHFLISAKLGNVLAQVNLANLYDDGKGCDQDFKQAVYWYKRAIKLGSAEGAFNLAVHYKFHNNLRWAKFWFLRAIKMGDEDAVFELDVLNKLKKNSM